MKQFFLSVIIGFYLMVCLQDMSMAVDIPAPTFTTPTDGGVPEKKYTAPTQEANLLTCATTALANKFPFDFFGVFDSNSGTAAAACPRIVMFANTSATISFEMCFVLQTIALLKYPLLIGLSISVIIAI